MRITSTKQVLFRLIGLICLLSLTGCTTYPSVRETLSATDVPSPQTKVELTTTPFFPQKTHQCGPAALASVLSAAGVAITPDELTNEVYLPARRGSLQLELLAATRRRGL